MSTTLSVLAVLAAGAGLLPTAQSPRGGGPGLLVSPAELASALKDPTVIVLTVADRPTDYETAHIPGARFIRYGDIAIDNDGVRSELPPIDRLRGVLAAAGVNERTKVVIYGSPMPASRLFFTLDYLGHPNVRLLNGGMNAWKASGGAVESGAGPRTEPVKSTLGAKASADRVVTADWIMSSIKPAATAKATSITLLDARPDSEFTGADGGMNGMHVPGHLPGAQQLVWNTLFDSTGKFLPDAELRKKFEAIGASTGTPLVSYCMVGMRASVTYFVARHLGYDSRMYDGSIEDWTRKRLPAQTGK